MTATMLPLQRRAEPRHQWRPCHDHDSGGRRAEVMRMAPFVRSRMSRGNYVHRPRLATWHWSVATDAEIAHVTKQLFRGDVAKGRTFVEKRVGPARLHVQTWCGMGVGTAGIEVLEQLPRVAVLCATCEGRAVGVGLPRADEIHPGVVTLFTPRNPEGWYL